MTPERGFTLIEVVVAITILGMSSTALFGLFGTSANNLRKIEDLHRYQLAAEEVMNRVLLLPSLPGSGRAGGRLDQVDANWTLLVEPWIPSSLAARPATAIVRVEVEVFWEGRSGRRRVWLETVRSAGISYDNADFGRSIDNVFP